MNKHSVRKIFDQPLLNIIILYLVRSNNPLVKNFKISTSQEDFEFKKLLINTIVILNRNPVMNEVNIF